MNKVSILDLPEDLLGDAPIKPISHAPGTKRKGAISKQHSPIGPTPIETLITEVATVLSIDPQELRDWGKEISVPTAVLKNILLTAKHYKLNPHLGNIAWELNTKNQWDIYIPIDGWISLIHREPSFQGISFHQAAETEQGIPIWMECTIYRSSLIHPITVREYFAELKTDHPMWVEMPRRMLRHKTMQQCARLALGIGLPELKISVPDSRIPNHLDSINNYCANNQCFTSPKIWLKQKLRANKI
ncbi:recombinase RecT [Polynucleobacter sp. HIN7]|uniref:recombinase RecT n=1 Tax=Polynucleobacter sp. HIN7 TaxID=3047866 RepID=UPI002572F767|nr:recombinase RecT [Polynucleobacter sp. HIN7]BEI36613.1 hypothetical protein PHIN7_03370 [Polynucleobacter sp. HIN7]